MSAVMDRQPGELTKKVDNIASSLVWVKVVGVGNAGVGKTCLIKHFCETKFSTGYQPTVGVDYGFKIQNAAGTDLRVHLWDLSGNAEYLDVRNELYGNTDAVFLVCDVTNQASFDSLDTWIRELTKYSNPLPDFCLVANKCDLREKRVISVADLNKWCSEHKINFYETSCATGAGVENMFKSLLTTVTGKRKISSKPSN